MKLKIRPANKNMPYSEEEVELMLSLAPTRENVRVLASSFKRSRKAIKLLYRMAYSGQWLKQTRVARHIVGGNNVIIKIARVKKRLGLCVGHRVR